MSHALAYADPGLDYVMAVPGTTFSLYPAKPRIGTGRRGRSKTFAEINLDLLSGDDAGFVWPPPLRSLSEGGTVEKFLGHQRILRKAIPVACRIDRLVCLLGQGVILA